MLFCEFVCYSAVAGSCGCGVLMVLIASYTKYVATPVAATHATLAIVPVTATVAIVPMIVVAIEALTSGLAITSLICFTSTCLMFLNENCDSMI